MKYIAIIDSDNELSEDAIRELKETVFIGDEKVPYCFDITSIKTLEQEPCDDAISRQAVLAIAGDSCLDLDSYEDTREFCDAIKELSSVTPQQKMGHWIFIDDIRSECSECGHREPNERFIFEDINFCAKCGADMREVEE